MADQSSVRQRVFRKVSLERLSSPEQLDLLIQVTSPRAWIALAALWLGLVALVTWSVVGRISTRVEAQGIILGGQIQDVVPVFGGPVRSLGASVGDEVTAGQILAVLDQPELELQIDNQKQKIRELEDEYAYTRDVTLRDLEIQRSYVAAERDNLTKAVSEQEQVFIVLNERAQAETEMLARGTISRSDWLATEQSLNTARDQLARSRADLTQLNSTELKAEFQAKQTLIQAEQRIHDAERQLREIENDYHLRSSVMSPFAGRVVEISVGIGDVLGAGQSIMKLRLGEGDSQLRAVLYVGGKDGKRVQPGMSVHVVPSTVRPEEFGYMVGTVQRVTELPATSQAMQQALRNDQLVSSLSSLTTPFQVDAEMLADSTAPSGYRWTSAPGPPVRVAGGTPARALIVVEQRRPIEMVVPALRRLFQLV